MLQSGGCQSIASRFRAVVLLCAASAAAACAGVGPTMAHPWPSSVRLGRPQHRTPDRRPAAYAAHRSQWAPRPILFQSPDLDRIPGLRRGASSAPSVVELWPAGNPRICESGLGGAWRYLRWCPGRSGAIVAGVESRGLAFASYEPARAKFGAAVSLASALGAPGARYTVSAEGFDCSPDGRRLVGFARGSGIFVIDLATGNRKSVVPFRSLGDDPQAVAWSPAGTQIAYSVPGKDAEWSGPDPQYDVWVMRPDGTARRRLGHGNKPCWSPDGRLLLAILHQGEEAGVYEVASGRYTRLRHAMSASIAGAVYSPLGTRIFWCAPLDQDHESIDDRIAFFTSDTEGRRLRVIMDATKFGIDTDLAWFCW